MIVEKRIKVSGTHHEIGTELHDGERVAMQAECEVSATTTKPAGDGNSIAIYTLKPLVVEIIGIDSEYQTPKQTAVPKNDSPSKRLRNTLYVLWEQQYKHKMGSEDHYNMVMDKIIDHYKDKLL